MLYVTLLLCVVICVMLPPLSDILVVFPAVLSAGSVLTVEDAVVPVVVVAFAAAFMVAFAGAAACVPAFLGAATVFASGFTGGLVAVVLVVVLFPLPVPAVAEPASLLLIWMLINGTRSIFNGGGASCALATARHDNKSVVACAVRVMCLIRMSFPFQSRRSCCAMCSCLSHGQTPVRCRSIVCVVPVSFLPYEQKSSGQRSRTKREKEGEYSGCREGVEKEAKKGPCVWYCLWEKRRVSPPLG